MNIFATVLQQARQMGRDSGWSHANFCEAYGWTEHGGGPPTDRTPRELTNYLFGGTTVEFEPARFENFCLDVYIEFVAGFQEGIDEFIYVREQVG